MTSWSLAFLIVAVLAALLGFAGITGAIASIAKIFVAVFILLFAVSVYCSHKHAWLKKHHHNGKS